MARLKPLSILLTICQLTLFVSFGYSQKREKIFISDIIENALVSKSDTIVIRDKLISQANYIKDKNLTGFTSFGYARRDSLYLFLRAKYKNDNTHFESGRLNLGSLDGDLWIYYDNNQFVITTNIITVAATVYKYKVVTSGSTNLQLDLYTLFEELYFEIGG